MMAVITKAKIVVDICGHQDTVHTENLSVIAAFYITFMQLLEAGLCFNS